MRLRALLSVLCVAVFLLCGCASSEDGLPHTQPVSADETLQQEINDLIDCYLRAFSSHDHSEMMRCTEEGFLYNRNETAFMNDCRDVTSYSDVIPDYDSLSYMDDDYLISVTYVFEYGDPEDSEGAYTAKRINEIFYMKYIGDELKICSISSQSVG